MKTKRIILVLIILMNIAFLSCGQHTGKKDVTSIEKSGMQNQQTIEMISPADLKAITSEIQLIDVRTPEEFKRGYIKGAKNINYFDNDFLEQMSTLNMDKPIYLYCRSANRSGKAASILKKRGFTKIYDLDGGILNWQRNKLTLEK